MFSSLIFIENKYLLLLMSRIFWSQHLWTLLW